MHRKLPNLDEFISCDFETLYNNEINLPVNSTGNDALDEYLGGGLPSGRLIHLSGPAGVGKSQFCMQLAASLWKRENVPLCYFLSCTKMSFNSTRYLQICAQLCPELNKDDEEIFLSNVFVAQTRSTEQLIKKLNELLNKTTEIGFVFIEGLFDIMQDMEQNEYRHSLAEFGRLMVQLANNKKCTVLFVNQVRAAFRNTNGNMTVPALGIGLYLHAAYRMSMDFCSEEERRIRLIKLDKWLCAYKEPLKFVLTKNGLSSV